ncbi:MAG: hypothetical protein QM765_30915 [Myxococcales bacterium]
MSRRAHVLAWGVLAAVALLVAAGAGVQARRALSQRSPPSAVLFDFDRGYSGFGLSTEEAVQAALFLPEAPEPDGKRTLGVRVQLQQGAAGRVRLTTDLGCSAWPHPDLHFAVRVGEPLQGATLRAYTLSGHSWRYLQSEAKPLAAGPNDVRVLLRKFRDEAESAEGALSVAGTNLTQVCELGFELDFAAGPARSGVLAIGAISAVGPRPKVESAAEPAGPVVEASATVHLRERGGRVPRQLMSFSLADDPSGDTALEQTLRSAGQGIVRLSLYPSVGKQLDLLQPARQWQALPRLDRAIAAVQRAGWEPAVVIGSVPAWAASPTPQEWAELAANTVSFVNHSRHRAVRYWVVRPWAEPPADAAATLAAISTRMKQTNPSIFVAVEAGSGAVRASEVVASGALPRWSYDAMSLTEREPAPAPSGVAATLARIDRDVGREREALDRAPGYPCGLWLEGPFAAAPGSPELGLDSPGWPAYWASVLLSAARHRVDAAFYPYLNGLAAGAQREPGSRALLLWRLLQHDAGLLDAEWTRASTTAPDLDLLGFVADDAWKVGAVVVNQSPQPRALHLTLEGAAGLRRGSLSQLAPGQVGGIQGPTEVTFDTRSGRNVPSSVLVLPGWSVTVVSGTLDQVVPAGTGPTASLDSSWVGAGGGLAVESVSGQVPVTADANGPPVADPNAAVLFSESAPGADDALVVAITAPATSAADAGTAIADRWVRWLVSRPKWAPVAMAGYQALTFSFRVEGPAPEPELDVLLLDANDQRGPSVASREYARGQGSEWRTVRIPLDALHRSEAADLKAVEFSARGLPASGKVRVFLDGIALVH